MKIDWYSKCLSSPRQLPCSKGIRSERAKTNEVPEGHLLRKSLSFTYVAEIDQEYNNYKKIRNQKKKENLADLKLLKKITAPFETSAYYEKLPIKPGFGFFDSLLNAPEADVRSLELNIPETLYITDSLTLLGTAPSGYIYTRHEYNYLGFMRKIESFKGKTDCELYDKVAVVLRGTDEDVQDLKPVALDWCQLRSSLVSRSQGVCLIQRFIKSDIKPSVFRLNYYAHIKANKSNFAYLIRSSALERNRGKSIQNCLVNTAAPEYISTLKVSGNILKPYEHYARNIVSFLNKGYSLRIQEIVLDFIQDQDYKLWFCGCKGFRVDPSSLTIPQWVLQSSKLHRISKLQKCKLCRLNYSNRELGYLVSVKMLVEFYCHASGRTELPSYMAQYASCSDDMLSQTLKVCHICYFLIDAELELIRAQQLLAAALNVPKQGKPDVAGEQIYEKPEFAPKVLKQWRLLVVCDKMYDLPQCKLPYLHIKLHNSVTSFSLECREGQPMSLKAVRMFYVFSDTKQMTPFKDLPLEIRVTEGGKFGSKLVCGTTSNVFDIFSSEIAEKQALLERKHICLFQGSRTAATLSLVAGVTNDKQIAREDIKSSMGKYNGLYFPGEKLFTPEPLPEPWMELITEFDEKPKQCSPRKVRRLKQRGPVQRPKHNARVLGFYRAPQASGKISPPTTCSASPKFSQKKLLRKQLALIKSYAMFPKSPNLTEIRRVNKTLDLASLEF